LFSERRKKKGGKSSFSINPEKEAESSEQRKEKLLRGRDSLLKRR